MPRFPSALLAVLTLSMAAASAAANPGASARGQAAWTSPTTGMEFVAIDPGVFEMGSPESEDGRYDDESLHRVTLTRPFYLGRFEVTQDEWRLVMGTAPSLYPECGGRCPVDTVSWDEAQTFLRRLGAQDGVTYRLPTEAEWEYAARGGGSNEFGASQIANDACWNNTNAADGPRPVGLLEANAFGLHDMHGNVYEWVQDRYGAYPEGSATDPGGPAEGVERVARGGAWSHWPRHCRSANRSRGSVDRRDDDLGFRVARDLN